METAVTRNPRTHIVLLKDWRQIRVTEPQYKYIRATKDSAKPGEMLTITDADNPELVLYDGNYSNIQEFKQVSAQKPADTSYRAEELRILRSKQLREKWTEEFLTENDSDGSIMESALATIKARIPLAVANGMAGEDFLKQWARAEIRMAYGCPNF